MDLLLQLLVLILCMIHTMSYPASMQFPCCSGSQHLVALMEQYANTFNLDMASDKHSFCSTAHQAVVEIKNALINSTMPDCESPAGGGAKMMQQIDAHLYASNRKYNDDDECAYSVGFISAMFEFASSASAHTDQSFSKSDPTKLTLKFDQQIGIIGELCNCLNIDIGIVLFRMPRQGKTDVSNK
ncbi:hypothetical protein niasHS_003164 [Heterodera schachtii]|uniref:Gland protein n=1 Tax=Heterodera schachtii TaxID=97005 RepID=A0ABD2KAC9_HETSC